MAKIRNFFSSAVFLSWAFFGSTINAQESPPALSHESLKQTELGIIRAVKKLMPATVSLYSKRTGASGSGVVVSADGLVLTAAHVIEGTREITVIFPDGEEYNAKTLGMNYTTDAGMVQILSAKDLPFVNYKSSEPLKTGDFVVAMGHPEGYDPTRNPPVRFGRVTSKAADHFFSTDCTIIGGDSGGPLVDLQGDLVGIHSSIAQSSAINNHAGISGFIADWDKMLAGEVWGQRNELGPMGNPDTPALGVKVGQAASGGIAVAGVYANSPAAIAGIKPGDVLLSIDNVPVDSMERMIYTLSGFRAGNEVPVRVRREGTVLDFNIKLGKRADFGR